MTSLPPIGKIPTLETRYYQQVLVLADTNQDNKASLDELKKLKADRDAVRFIQAPGQNWTKSNQAIDILINHFGVFATNRGLPPDAVRTMEFRVGEDDHIDSSEIDAVAARDGRAQNISARDLGIRRGEHDTPGCDHHPGPPLTRLRRPIIVPIFFPPVSQTPGSSLPPLQPGQIAPQQLILSLFSALLQNLMSNGEASNNFWKQAAGNNNPWFS